MRAWSIVTQLDTPTSSPRRLLISVKVATGMAIV